MGEYPVIRVTGDEVRLLLQIHGWKGVFGHLKQIVAHRGLLWTTGRDRKVMRCVKTWWENDCLYHQNYDVEIDPHNAMRWAKSEKRVEK